MKKKIAIILLLLISVAIGVCWAQQDDYKEGDILFQVSKSRQSPLIQKATGSKWSHCGVVVEKNKKLFVLEASKVVRLTPLQQWIKQGKDEKVKMMRVKKDPVKIKYNKYLEKSYDLAFKFDNVKWYCSELIYDIYKSQLGIELCKPKQLRQYQINGMEDVIKKRGMSLDQLVVAPSDLLDY